MMARGSKDKYTSKQKRQAEHIEKGYEKRGLDKDEAERRAWATVNKVTGGGKKAGSGCKKAAKKKAVTSKAAKKAAPSKTAARKKVAKKRTAKKSARGSSQN